MSMHSFKATQYLKNMFDKLQTVQILIRQYKQSGPSCLKLTRRSWRDIKIPNV